MELQKVANERTIRYEQGLAGSCRERRFSSTTHRHMSFTCNPHPQLTHDETPHNNHRNKYNRHEGCSNARLYYASQASVQSWTSTIPSGLLDCLPD